MIQPYQEDFFQRIVNVNWSSRNIVVFGTDRGELYYFKITPGNQAPEVRKISLGEPSGWGDEGQIPRFSVRGLSYHEAEKGNPVWVLVGHRSDYHEGADGAGNIIAFIDDSVRIYTSEDGLSWSQTYNKQVVNTLELQGVLDIAAVVWDPKDQQFFASSFGVQFARHTGEAVIPRAEILLSSKDGFGWSTSGTNPVPEDGSFVSILPPHSPHSFLDRYGQRVPDGIMETLIDENGGKTDVHPIGPVTFQYGGTGGNNGEGSSVVIGGTVVPVPGIVDVFCATASGNSFVFAAGNDGTNTGIAMYSTDAAQTWTRLGVSPVGVIVGAVAGKAA